MSLTYQRKRLADLAGAVKRFRGLSERERWPRERLAAFQQRELEAVVRHAVAHSAFYRERIGPLAGPVELARLPVLDKATMMEHYDALVTDPRLRRDDLLARVEGHSGGDPLVLGRYRVMTTSGSSGRRGLFVYDRPEWSALLAQFLRYNALAGVKPRLPRRLRVAAIGGASPAHMTRQVTQTIDIGLHRVLSLPVTLPLAVLVERLNAFQPQFMNVYPTVAVLLAEEQLAGRLRIAPERMSTSSELRTAEMTARLEQAFGVRPYDFYGTTEGLWGAECDERQGVHLFEDCTLVENVDEEGRPVPAGRPGARLLITSLANRTQPLIRLELTDAVTLDPDPCPCGRTLVRVAAITGRTDDVLRLPGHGGQSVAVHPLQFAVVARDREVVEFQVVQEPARLRLLVVPRGEAPALEARLGNAVLERLRALGVAEPDVAVERRPALARQPGGKLQLVVACRDATEASAR